MVAAAEACAEAVTAFCLAGGDDASPQAAAAGVATAVLRELAVTARRLDWGDVVAEAERGRAAPAGRRPGRGHLRAVR